MSMNQGPVSEKDILLQQLVGVKAILDVTYDAQNLPQSSAQMNMMLKQYSPTSSSHSSHTRPSPDQSSPFEPSSTDSSLISKALHKADSSPNPISRVERSKTEIDALKNEPIPSEELIKTVQRIRAKRLSKCL